MLNFLLIETQMSAVSVTMSSSRVFLKSLKRRMKKTKAKKTKVEKVAVGD